MARLWCHRLWTLASPLWTLVILLALILMNLRWTTEHSQQYCQARGCGLSLDCSFLSSRRLADGTATLSVLTERERSLNTQYEMASISRPLPSQADAFSTESPIF
jgi:hypothetical protein